MKLSNDTYKTVECGTKVEFLNAANLEVNEEMDLDNVILTTQQKWRLAIQMMKKKEFWILYSMQFLSICKYNLTLNFVPFSYLM